MASLRKRGRVWYYRITDAEGVKVERKGCSDKRATEDMARAAESEAARIRDGLLDPKDLAYMAHGARSLADHLSDWHAHLIAKGGTIKHAAHCRSRAARLVELAGARRISDLSPSRVQSALKAVRDEGAALRTVHHHVRAIKGFGRWLWRDGRAREDSLAHLTSPNPDADRRRERRALAPAELARLIAAAEAGPVVLKVPGPDRAALYLVAAGTGFRAGELASLTPESFDLDGDPPTVTVAAAYSKRRREDAQPIRPDLAEALRPWLASKATGRPVFPIDSHHTAEMVRRDLEAAGIPYRDASGRVADFHALRHSYVTMLALSGAPVKVVQSLARHSTPTLTLGIYAHVGLFDQAGALDAMPSLTPQGPSREPSILAATGTDGGRINDPLAHHLPTGGDGIGRSVADAGGIDAPEGGSSVVLSIDRNSLGSEDLDAPSRGLAVTGIAEGVGFEPTVGLTLQRFSRPPQSTTLAPLRGKRIRALIDPLLR